MVCDADVCQRAGWTPSDFAAACLDGGATFLQVRAKTASSRDFLAVVEDILRRAEPYDGIIIVNDRADIARIAGADGVHVGQDDLTPSDVRTIVGDEATVGLSTHTVEQLRAANVEPVDYVAIGPVFGTSTKDTGYSAVGLDMVRAAADVMNGRVPVVAIGGITLDRAADVVAAGAASVAVITDLLAGNDPAVRVRAYLSRLARV